MARKASTGPIWILARVKSAAAFGGRPHAEQFTTGQSVSVWQLSNGKWMVFAPEQAVYTILTRAQAVEGLRAERTAAGQVILAADQVEITRSFYQAVARHGTVFACRPRY